MSKKDIYLPRYLVDKLVEKGVLIYTDEGKERLESAKRRIQFLIDEDADAYKNMVSSFNIDGKEYPCEIPKELPVGMRKPETYHDQLERILNHRDMRAAVDQTDKMTFREFMEFEAPDSSDVPISMAQSIVMNDDYVLDNDGPVIPLKAPEKSAVVPPATTLQNALTQEEIAAFRAKFSSKEEMLAALDTISSPTNKTE